MKIWFPIELHISQIKKNVFRVKEQKNTRPRIPKIMDRQINKIWDGQIVHFTSAHKKGKKYFLFNLLENVLSTHILYGVINKSDEFTFVVLIHTLVLTEI